MKWKVDIAECEPVIVDLPSKLVKDSWTPISLQGKRYFVQWNKSLNTIYLKDQNGLERPLKVRGQNMVQFPGEVQRRFQIEISGAGFHLVNRLETVVEPSVPGSAFRKSSANDAGATVRAPMVGKVIKVLVSDGDLVTKGQELLVIEAMKMENKILAPVAGQVSKLKAKEGEQTGIGDALMQIELANS
ncbi:acetyl-CoA carboxylase biotin carboxyl carrier protein subunit [Pseudobacteriovorax antillogorgiicola]|uniref:Biotin-requiring enzyme n=1 Tax=Pseudobacteriovorax antillogorgiicola TaxID=1513793 RepID=A0A1Y6CSV2_9BACT|nr:acetyl-CoA carboxylase biotin carboxyl carrier protein subunit [Pseudobacteriovorax antillogorgiicola]TCS45876.1 biotin-dependent enzyme [Pseudobacteriovorax antillogorgiicola]SMF71260.1 Biotin-requiring enzyme [Pseudobacteriovorax antillogorgiicola]